MDEKLETTPETQTPQLNAIDKATLTPLVRSALNSATIGVTRWGYEQLHGGFSGGTIYRFLGEGRDQGRTMRWSLILKILRPVRGGIDRSAGNYRREADAYQSGWLDDLPGSLVAPRCYGVTDHPDGTCWIWLEDITDVFGARWPLEHYGVVARHLGQFNGAYLVDGPLPAWPWLSSGFLRGSVARATPVMSVLRDSLDHPLVRRWLPGDAGERLFRFWEERELFMDALDRLPQTLCHLDAFRRNLLARKTATGDCQTVAVDWAFAGRGAIGEELVPLVQASIATSEVEVAQGQELEDIVFEGYLVGLRDAGWRGDPRQVRLGYTAASLRYRFEGGWLALMLDESRLGSAEADGLSVEEFCDGCAQVWAFIDYRIDEARELIEGLG